MLELKEYQERTLDAFSHWLEELEAARQQLENTQAVLEQSGVAMEALRGADVDPLVQLRNYPRTAWGKLAESGGLAETAGGYVSRSDDAGRPIPHVCFKVPTGGGKTLLAAAALERLNRQTGLTLWITPTRTIYRQTQTALRNREHPYREMLERASGGRVKLLEKDDIFTAGDVANYLCIMLLMLPAANRRKGREFLRMFRDSGRYPTFFPDSDDILGDGRMLERNPDLERDGENGPVKHSLFNLFKMLRPVVVLDEAHKAYGAARSDDNQEFVRSVNRLDPSLVIELSATPNRGVSNLLVDVTGVELKNEEMIKLPVQVNSYHDVDWQYTLGEAQGQLELLAEEAQQVQDNQGRYIRPIAVVRVERTGKDQRDGERIHAEDVRECLTLNLNVPAEQIRVKSSENDEIGREDLLSENSSVRWVITKSALMEGWDCPFAYVLVMLDNTQAQRAITQLVGRVMRQPHARRTGMESLDQCYVYCRNVAVGQVVEQVKRGLEQEGLTGLGGEVKPSNEAGLREVTVQRREAFQGQEIFLPKALHQTSGGGWEELDYQRHILPAIDWGALTPPEAQQGGFGPGPSVVPVAIDLGPDNATAYYAPQELVIDTRVQISWYARRLADLMPNPWQAARVAQELVDRMRRNGYDDAAIYRQRSLLAAQLRQGIAAQIERRAEKIFKDKLRRGEIRFDLEIDDHNFRMAESYPIQVAERDTPLMRYGEPVQLGLFEPMYAADLNDMEQRFAFYLDEQKALQWWHRVAERQQGDYYLRGWRRERIWPDFVAMAGAGVNGRRSILIFETKGQHLAGNEDTEYKKRVLATLEEHFNGGVNAGHMVIREGPAQGAFRLVFSDDNLTGLRFPEAEAAIAMVSRQYRA